MSTMEQLHAPPMPAPPLARPTRRAVLVGGAVATMTAATAGGLVWRARRDEPAPVATGPIALVSPGLAVATPMATAVTGIDLPVLPLEEGQVTRGVRVVPLRLGAGTTSFVAGAQAATWGINRAHLGPVVRVRKGERVRMAVRNDLGETTTLHWHGAHLPAAMDGGPFQPIKPGTTWSPEWVVRQPASTLWFHPHLMGKTREQVLKGLAGLLIIDDDDPGSAGLPHDYGVDDFAVIVQEHRLNARGELGTSDGQRVTLVNGAIAPRLALPAGHARLRLVNTSDAADLRLALADGSYLLVVGVDGGRLEGPEAMKTVILGPGERVEVVVRGTGTLVSLDAKGADAGPAEPLLRFESTGGPAPGLAGAFGPVDLPDPTRSVVTRRIALATGGPGGMTIMLHAGDGTMQETSHEDMASMFSAKVGTTETWEIENQTSVVHYFHVHDVQFKVIDRDGTPPLPHERGPKDTVRVEPRSTVRIALAFADYASRSDRYMFHCHMLAHEDQGMMGAFTVTK